MWKPFVEVTGESYEHVCPRCDRQWIVDYAVRRYREPGGDVVETFFRNGVPSAAPGGAAMCPSCHWPRVVTHLLRSGSLTDPVPPSHGRPERGTPSSLAS